MEVVASGSCGVIPIYVAISDILSRSKSPTTVVQVHVPLRGRDVRVTTGDIVCDAWLGVLLKSYHSAA